MAATTDVVVSPPGRVSRPDLSDDEYEMLLVAVEQLYPSTDEAVGAIAERLRRFRSKYGDGALIAFADMLLAYFEQLSARRGTDRSAPTSADSPPGRVDHNREARRRLLITTRCPLCGKVRRGRQWLRMRPPAGHFVLRDYCPTCAEALDNGLYDGKSESLAFYH